MFIGSNTKESAPAFIREVALLPGETIDHVFSPELGLTQDPDINGEMLVATNQRIVSILSDVLSQLRSESCTRGEPARTVARESA